MKAPSPVFGKLSVAVGQPLPLEVKKSRAGYYLGTSNEEGPFTRESVEYWPKAEQATKALTLGLWTQRRAL
jgi:hypothetical protein